MFNETLSCCSWRSINREILAIAQGCIVRINPCFLLVSLSYTAIVSLSSLLASFLYVYVNQCLWPAYCQDFVYLWFELSLVSLHSTVVQYWAAFCDFCAVALTLILHHQGCLTSLGRPWWSCIVPSAWMCTHPSPLGTTTLTGPTLGLASPTCSSWCTPSTGQNDLPTSLCQGLPVLFLLCVHVSWCAVIFDLQVL